MRPMRTHLQRAKPISWAKPRWIAWCCASRRIHCAIWPTYPWWCPCRPTRSRLTLSHDWRRRSKAIVPRIEDNKLQIRHSRLQHGVGMAIVLVLVVAVIVIVYLLLATVLVNLPATVQGMIAGGVCVFTWVILWDPLEALLFDWVAPTREIHVFEKIMKMRVSVQAQA